MDRIDVAAACECQVFDVGGEYMYHHLQEQLPTFSGITVVITISLTPNADEQLKLWVDVLADRSCGASNDVQVLFVGTKGSGTIAELRTFRGKVERVVAGMKRKPARSHIAMLVMLEDQTCFLQHAHDRDAVVAGGERAEDIPTANTWSVAEDVCKRLDEQFGGNKCEVMRKELQSRFETGQGIADTKVIHNANALLALCSHRYAPPDVSAIASVVRYALMQVVHPLPHKLIDLAENKLGRPCRFDDGRYIPWFDATTQTRQDPADADLKYRILEAVMHRNDKDRIADTVFRSVVMLLAGASLRSTAAPEAEAYFRCAMEIASRLTDRSDNQLRVYRRVCRSRDRLAQIQRDDAAEEQRYAQEATSLKANVGAAGIPVLVMLVAQDFLNNQRLAHFEDAWQECQQPPGGSRDELEGLFNEIAPCREPVDHEAHFLLMRSIVLLGCHVVHPSASSHSDPSSQLEQHFSSLKRSSLLSEPFQEIVSLLDKTLKLRSESQSIVTNRVLATLSSLDNQFRGVELHVDAEGKVRAESIAVHLQKTTPVLRRYTLP